MKKEQLLKEYMGLPDDIVYSLVNPAKFPRQTLVKEPKLVGKTAGVVFEYRSEYYTGKPNFNVQQEYIVAPIDPIGYITELLKWFNAEERAIEAMPLNDMGTKNVYKANLRHFIRIVPDHEILEETKMQIPDGTKCAGCKKEFHVNEYRHQYPAMVDNIILCSGCERGDYVRVYLGQRAQKRKKIDGLKENTIGKLLESFKQGEITEDQMRDMAEQISEPIKESLRTDTATTIMDHMGRPRRVEVPNVNTLKQKPTKTIKLGKWSVHEETFNDYVIAVRKMRMYYDPNSIRNRHSETGTGHMRDLYELPFDPFASDPVERLATFQQRVKIHKKLFKEAGVPYHGNANATKASHDLYALIEKRMEKEL